MSSPEEISSKPPTMKVFDQQTPNIEVSVTSDIFLNHKPPLQTYSTPPPPPLPASIGNHSLSPSLPPAGTIAFSDEIDHEYFDSFPPGYRFCPFDEELVVHYLQKKVMNQPLPKNRIVDVTLYQYNPEYLAEKYKHCGEKEWYFFTPRYKKYKNGTRPSRSTGDGYWKATGADRPVKYKGSLVGYRKALVFYTGKAPKGDKTNWIMHEFRVKDAPQKSKKGTDDMRLDEWVLCRIYKKTEKPNVRARQRDDEHSTMAHHHDDTSTSDHHHHLLQQGGDDMDHYENTSNPLFDDDFGQVQHFSDAALIHDPTQPDLSHYPSHWYPSPPPVGINDQYLYPVINDQYSYPGRVSSWEPRAKFPEVASQLESAYDYPPVPPYQDHNNINI